MIDTKQQDNFAPAPDVSEEFVPEESVTYNFWDNDTTAAPELYIKTSTISASYSDVTLLLGNPYWEQQVRVNLCKLRLTMSHLDFFEFAEIVRKQSELLKRLYNGNSPGPEFTQEEYDVAWREVYGNG